jgi:glycosyltransferase involved in cell wall biosynthesis
MPSVLIATDDLLDPPNWMEGYHAAGWQVHTGTSNFKLGGASYDVIHYQWPEELSRWRPPDEKTLFEIKSRLNWWKHRTAQIITVNNLYPHCYNTDNAFFELYSTFYSICDVITHYTDASRELVCRRYPRALDKRHVVHSPFNYCRLLSLQERRGSARTSLGINRNDFVMLVFGALRSWDEIELIQEAFRVAKIKRKRLLVAARYSEYNPAGCSPLARRLRHWRWRMWLKRSDVTFVPTYIPDEKLYQIFDSSDVVVVPRLNDLNSAVVASAMTFGRPVVAPNHGSYPEVLHGTGAILYSSQDARSLANALEVTAASDLEAIGRRSAEIAASWSWKQIVEQCLSSLSDSWTSGTLPRLNR